ncbi:MAG: hypothetical protein RQ729_04555 [Wenzhouxiangellaceae bacterium]|nr:hypothetical protein [Wenzhouxiangellaceae bacterium]
MPASEQPAPPRVRRWNECDAAAVRELLGSFGLTLIDVPRNAAIPGSYWGDDEAGLIGNALYARPDTPLHSILHEACHWICMDESRRSGLHTDAGGDYDEENAVCYLQIVLAGRVPDYGRAACMADMDAWGYSARLGSTAAWFEGDAEDARAGLSSRGIDPDSGGEIAAANN